MKNNQAYLEKIGHLIQEFRIGRGLTQTELAKKSVHHKAQSIASKAASKTLH